jgi:hypothetical protein
MGITQKAATAYWLFRKGKKAYTYTKLVKQSIDEDTRPGALMKLGIRGALDIAGKAIGVSLTSHPYFQYHKVHLEALAQALNASSNLDDAEDALNNAIRSADSAASLTRILNEYQIRQDRLKLIYVMNIRGPLLILSDIAAAEQIASLHETRESLQSDTDQNVYEWRAQCCDLFMDSLQLLAMSQVESNIADLAMQRFDQKMDALSHGGGIGFLFAAQAKNNRVGQQVDRMLKPGNGSALAVADPVGYARSQVDKIERMTVDLGDGCDAAMSDDAYNPEFMVHSMVDW